MRERILQGKKKKEKRFLLSLFLSSATPCGSGETQGSHKIYLRAPEVTKQMLHQIRADSFQSLFIYILSGHLLSNLARFVKKRVFTLNR